MKDLSKQRFFVELQSLRGLAAVLVLLGHSMDMYAEPTIVYVCAAIFNGRAAVVLFFVLSGFVLTRSLNGTDLNATNWGRFLIRRAARIYPAIWFISLISIVYILTLRQWVPLPDASVYFLARFQEHRVTALAVLASCMGVSTALVPQLWTISVELAASVVMPPIAFLAFNRKLTFSLLAAASLIVSFSFGQRLPLAAGIFGPSFLAGAWLATGSRRQQQFFAAAGPAAKIIVGVLAFLFLFTQFLPLTYTSPLACLIETILSTAIIGLIVYSDADIKILRSPYLTRLGDISYSLYLVHYLIGGILLSLLSAWQIPEALGLAGGWKAVIFAVCVLVVTIACADRLHSHIELPGIELGKQLLLLVPKRSQSKVRT